MNWARRNVCLWMLGLSACGGGDGTVKLPAAFGGQWRLAGSAAETDVPEVAKQLGLKAAMRGRYEGDNGELTVRIFRMAAQASAFELIQKWRAEPGTLHFQSEDLFVVL